MSLMEEIVTVATGFAPQWETFTKQWEDEKCLPLYVAMGELAHYVIDCYSSDNTSEFEALFALLEEQFTKGDSELENLIVAGLFEAMQGISSHRPFSYQVFRKWLGARSLVAWDEIDAGMREVAVAATARNRRRWWQFWRRRTGLDPKKALAEVQDPELKKLLEAQFRDFESSG